MVRTKWIEDDCGKQRVCTNYKKLEIANAKQQVYNRTNEKGTKVFENAKQSGGMLIKDRQSLAIRIGSKFKTRRIEGKEW